MFGIDMGVSGDQYAQHGALENASGFATGAGMSDLAASNDFFKAILSGDATKQMQALAPEVSAAKTSAAQGNKTAAEFGTRSGGTAASTAATNDKVHADITNLLGQLTGGAAGSLASTGSNLLGLGMQGDALGFQQAGDIQKQKLAKFNDIMNSIASTATGFATGGMIPLPNGEPGFNWRSAIGGGIGGALPQ